MASHCDYSILKSPSPKTAEHTHRQKKKNGQETTIRTPTISHTQEIKDQIHSQFPVRDWHFFRASIKLQKRERVKTRSVGECFHDRFVFFQTLSVCFCY